MGEGMDDQARKGMKINPLHPNEFPRMDNKYIHCVMSLVQTFLRYAARESDNTLFPYTLPWFPEDTQQYTRCEIKAIIFSA